MADRADEFEVNTDVRDGARVVSVRGELDLGTHERLSEELTEAAGGKEPIVVDLTECDFVDSSGVRALLLGLREAGPDAGRFSIAGPTPQVQRLLEMTGLGKAVPVHGSLEAALDSVG